MRIRSLLKNLKIALIFAGTLTGILFFCASCGTGVPLLDRMRPTALVLKFNFLESRG